MMEKDLTTQPVLDLSRRWQPQDWEQAREDLQQRGWMDRDGTLTPAGVAGQQDIEDRTDHLAAKPLSVLSETQLLRLIELARRVSRQVVAAGGVPFPNPMGLPDMLSGDNEEMPNHPA